MADGAATSEAVIFSAPYCPINDPSSLNRLGSGSAYSSKLSLSLSRGPYLSKSSGLPAKGCVSPLK